MKCENCKKEIKSTIPKPNAKIEKRVTLPDGRTMPAPTPSHTSFIDWLRGK